ncbi:MAG: BrnA antitoxin family protein [Neisseria sp.]|nr:BrnA antitoxin family protein [Neisseria sp.]
MNKPLNKALTDKMGEARELNRTDFSQFKPAAEVMGEEFMAMVRTRGKQKSPTKVATTVRLDSRIIEHFKAGGKGWQTRMNDALLEWISR